MPSMLSAPPSVTTASTKFIGGAPMKLATKGTVIAEVLGALDERFGANRIGDNPRPLHIRKKDFRTAGHAEAGVNAFLQVVEQREAFAIDMLDSVNQRWYRRGGCCCFRLGAIVFGCSLGNRGALEPGDGRRSQSSSLKIESMCRALQKIGNNPRSIDRANIARLLERRGASRDLREPLQKEAMSAGSGRNCSRIPQRCKRHACVTTGV